MDFALNEEQLAIRNTCREFAEREIQPIAEQIDATGQIPYLEERYVLRSRYGPSESIECYRYICLNTLILTILWNRD